MTARLDWEEKERRRQARHEAARDRQTAKTCHARPDDHNNRFNRMLATGMHHDRDPEEDDDGRLVFSDDFDNDTGCYRARAQFASADGGDATHRFGSW